MWIIHRNKCLSVVYVDQGSLTLLNLRATSLVLSEWNDGKTSWLNSLGSLLFNIIISIRVDADLFEDTDHINEFSIVKKIKNDWVKLCQISYF